MLCIENMSVLDFVPDLLSVSKQFVGFSETDFELFIKFTEESDQHTSCQNIN